MRATYEPLVNLIKNEIKPEHQQLYPAPVWKLTDRIGRLARNILVSEFLVREWAEHFAGKSEAEIDAIAKSFAFENCLHREGLNKVLTDNATLVAGNGSSVMGRRAVITKLPQRVSRPGHSRDAE